MKYIIGCFRGAVVVLALAVMLIGWFIFDVLTDRRPCSEYSFQNAVDRVSEMLQGAWFRGDLIGIAGAKLCAKQSGREKTVGDPKSPFIVAICKGQSDAAAGYVQVFEDCEKVWVPIVCPTWTVYFSC